MREILGVHDDPESVFTFSRIRSTSGFIQEFDGISNGYLALSNLGSNVYSQLRFGI